MPKTLQCIQHCNVIAEGFHLVKCHWPHCFPHLVVRPKSGSRRTGVDPQRHFWLQSKYKNVVVKFTFLEQKINIWYICLTTTSKRWTNSQFLGLKHYIQNHALNVRLKAKVALWKIPSTIVLISAKSNQLDFQKDICYFWKIECYMSDTEMFSIKRHSIMFNRPNTVFPIKIKDDRILHGVLHRITRWQRHTVKSVITSVFVLE